MPSPAGPADDLAAAFTEKTGVEVEQFQGTTGEILARLEAEQANPVADVVILASWSDGLGMKADGQLESYTPANADKVNEGWIDDDNMLFGSSASAVGVIYNTTVIPELSADWSELADAYLLPGRSDIRCENRTNLSDITLIPTDWDKMMEVASDTAAKLNSLCQ